MGYVLQGLIAAKPAVSEAARRLSAAAVDLEQGLHLLPGPVIDPDELVGDVDPLWRALVERIATAAVAASELGRIAYVEADFTGGTGQQSAVVWQRGRPVLGPFTTPFVHHTTLTSDSPINAALRHLGARRTGNHDEFESVGLNRHRHIKDWLPEP